MKIIEKEFKISINNIPENSLLFDIETTGLKKECTNLYLFGCLSKKSNDIWTFKQWLIESPNEEKEAIVSICNYITNFKILIHFNGDRFDIPYMDYHANLFGYDSPFSKFESFDLYKKLKHLKNFYKLTCSKEKEFQNFLGCERKDIYNGGQLIPIYYEYCNTKSKDLLNALLLHNEEDVLGMTELFRLVPAADLINSNQIIYEKPSVVRRETDSIFLSFKLKNYYEFNVSHNINNIYLALDGDKINLKIPLINGVLKFFFPHARDYYYLPYEDMAIHKSVASFVDNAHKEKATIQNCYAKKEGVFFPLMNMDIEKVYKNNYDGEPYGELTNEILDDVFFWNNYINAFFKKIKKGL